MLSKAKDILLGVVSIIAVVGTILALVFWFKYGEWKEKALDYEAQSIFWEEQHKLKDDVAKEYAEKNRVLTNKVGIYDKKLQALEGDPNAQEWLETTMPASVDATIPYGM